MDYPEPVSVNRWYLDGYRARLNGKPLSANPKSRPKPVWNWRTKKYEYQPQEPAGKAARWDAGWLDANDAVKGLVEWDREQEVIDALQET